MISFRNFKIHLVANQKEVFPWLWYNGNLPHCKILYYHLCRSLSPLHQHPALLNHTRSQRRGGRLSCVIISCLLSCLLYICCTMYVNNAHVLKRRSQFLVSSSYFFLFFIIIYYGSFHFQKCHGFKMSHAESREQYSPRNYTTTSDSFLGTRNGYFADIDSITMSCQMINTHITVSE